MRTHLEFRAAGLVDAVCPRGTAGGSALARLLAAGLPRYGFTPRTPFPEDWGWCVPIENSDFPLWIGCDTHADWPDGHLCFIAPCRPRLRRWLRVIDTRPRVTALAGALELILAGSGLASDLRWWTQDEVTPA